MENQPHITRGATMGLIIAAVLAINVGVASAHHSFALFDTAKRATLVGQVKELQWTNPHIWIQLMVPSKAGKPVEWSIEGASLNSLVRQGWKRTSVKKGDTVEIVVNPARDGTNLASLVRLSVHGQVVGRSK